MNLAKYVRNNPDLFATTLPYKNISLNIQSALTLVASNKQWFVQVYKADQTQYRLTQASRCLDCFQVFNVNNDYHIFVAGVDSTALPNPAV